MAGELQPRHTMSDGPRTPDLGRRVDRRTVLKAGAGGLLIGLGHRPTDAQAYSNIEDGGLAQLLLSNTATPTPTAEQARTEQLAKAEAAAQGQRTIETPHINIAYPTDEWIAVPDPKNLATLLSRIDAPDGIRGSMTFNTAALPAGRKPEELQTELVSLINTERQQYGEDLRFDEDPAALQGFIYGETVADDIPFWNVVAERVSQDNPGVKYFFSSYFFPRNRSLVDGQVNNVITAVVVSSPTKEVRNKVGPGGINIIHDIKVK